MNFCGYRKKLDGDTELARAVDGNGGASQLTSCFHFLLRDVSKRNRKHILCVSIERRTRKAVETLACCSCFHSL